MTQAQSAEERDLLLADDRRRAAMQRGDVEALDGLLAAGLRHVHANGRCEDKSDYLAMIARHPSAYRRIDRPEAAATVRGDVGWIAAVQDLVIERDGVRSESSMRCLSVWVREAGAWRMAAFSTTRIAT